MIGPAQLEEAGLSLHLDRIFRSDSPKSEPRNRLTFQRSERGSSGAFPDPS
jgi:hypothetical protein